MSRTTMLMPLAALVGAVALGAPGSALPDERAFTRTADSADLGWGPCPAFMPDDCRIAVLHGDPAEPGADVFFKLPAGRSVPAHWHHSAERMVLVSGEMRVTYAGQMPVTLKAGTYAYGPAEAEHDATCTSDEDCVLFIAFEKPVDAIPTGDGG